MRFDINTAVGYWPFRQIADQTPSQLRKLLESKGIDGAATANTHGLFYKNCHDANLELAEWLADHADFFVGVATLNPTYAAWERDLQTCREDLSFRALRLVPQYHDYKLGGPESVAIARAATDLCMPILIPHRVVDIRQRHWFDTERTNSFEEIAALCEAVPEARVVVTESPFGGNMLLNEDESLRYPGLYLGSSRVGTAGLKEHLAADRIVFGTGAPFKSIAPALLKIADAELSETAQARIEHGNARGLLGMAGK